MVNHPNRAKKVMVSFIKDGHGSNLFRVFRNQQVCGFIQHQHGAGWAFVTTESSPSLDGSLRSPQGRDMAAFCYRAVNAGVWAQVVGARFERLGDAMQAVIDADPRAAKYDCSEEAKYFLRRLEWCLSEGLGTPSFEEKQKRLMAATTFALANGAKLSRRQARAAKNITS